jgi:hypothetical protein
MMLPLGELNLRLSQNAETFCESYLKLAPVSLAKKLQEVFQNEPRFERPS